MDFEVVIGLEIHCRLSTKSKMFCRCKNDAFYSQPNTNVCEVCMGFPGQLPVLNKDVLEKGIKLARALNCEIAEESKLDRKNYFYPDNPRGFQISQFDQPFSKDGYLDIEFFDGKEKSKKRINIVRIHIEDDAGKLTHFEDFTLIDFNRAGIPLLEIVTAPELSSSAEASRFAREIQKIIRYVGVGEADMEKGMLRFDASISLKEKGNIGLNPRAEIKNLNSFKSLENALEYEIERQIEIYLKGEKLVGDMTLGFDEVSQKTYFMRDKEASYDYRYFPEPDLPKILINSKNFSSLEEKIELPMDKKNKYLNLGINEEEAEFISSDFKLSKYFDQLIDLSADIKLSLTFFNSVLMQYLKEEELDIDDSRVSPKMLSELIKYVKEDKISLTQAKNDVFPEMFKEGSNAEEIIKNKNIVQILDKDFIKNICEKVLEENEETVSAFKSGKERVLGFLVGLVMKESKGTANPSLVNEILRDLISKM